MELMAFISFFLGASWDFFTEIVVPGTDFTLAALFVGLFLAVLGLRFLGAMLGISGFGGLFTDLARRNPRTNSDSKDLMVK